MRMKTKRGQVTIFVIVALVIVGIVLVVLLYPRIRLPGGESATADPKSYLQSCIAPEIKLQLERLSQQAGYDLPLGFIVYNESKIPYLCYTSDYYKTCVVQQPDISGNFERSLAQLLQARVHECVTSFEEVYEQRGYSITRGSVNVTMTFAPERLLVYVNAPLTVSNEIAHTYQSFELGYPTQLHEILSIATSIIDFESSYGDSETTLYMRYYPDIKIQKTKLSDGTKIYTISDVVSDEHFTFASRSLSWPPGYLE